MYAYQTKEKNKQIDKKHESHLSQLIHQLTLDMNKVKFIKNPEALLKSLIKLQNIVGMHELKENIAKQTSYLIQKMKSGDFTMNMLNTTLYGNPGTGKTTVGLLLADIWQHLGFLQRATPKSFDIDIPLELLQVYIMMGTVVVIKLYNDILYPLYQHYGLVLTILFLLFCLLCLYFIFTYTHNPDNQPIVITSRSTFVGQYIGSTAPKTEQFLQNNLGRVVFIDEAYSLYNGHQDLYGIEALDCINKFLSEHSNEIVVIFAGYQDKLEQTIFKIQPGLNRRCMWKFDCQDYHGAELFDIFKLQCEKEKQQIYKRDEERIKNYFIKHENDFVNNAGDTERLVFYTLLNKTSDAMTYDDIKVGFKELRKVNLKTNKSLSDEFKKYLNI